MLTDAQRQARDAGRDIGAELLAAAQELAAGRWARKTTFEALPDGSVRRTVVRADGALEKQEVLVGAQWQLLAARAAREPAGVWPCGLPRRLRVLDHIELSSISR